MSQTLDPVDDLLAKLFEDTETTKSHCVVVFNDDVNTFDHVIMTLMIVCDKDALASEQLALQIHTRGKAQVYSADYNQCVVAHRLLTEALLNAEVQEL